MFPMANQSLQILNS